IFLFMLAAAAASVVMFGLLPALQATRTNIVQATRGEFASDARPSALRNALVVGQVTVCVLLLTCAGILLSGVSDLALPDFGLTTRGILWLDVRDHGDARTRVLD